MILNKSKDGKIKFIRMFNEVCMRSLLLIPGYILRNTEGIRYGMTFKQVRKIVGDKFAKDLKDFIIRKYNVGDTFRIKSHEGLINCSHLRDYCKVELIKTYKKKRKFSWARALTYGFYGSTLKRKKQRIVDGNDSKYTIKDFYKHKVVENVYRVTLLSKE